MLSAAAGLLAAIAVDAAAGRRRDRVALHAAGLSLAAAVYPLARSDRPIAREMLAFAGFSTLAAVTARTDATRLLAAGWLGHAVFDFVHDGGPQSRLPAWYPAFCAGYDAGVAVMLFAGPPTRHSGG